MPGTPDGADLSGVIAGRLVCHWLLSNLPDQVVLEMMKLLAEKWRLYFGPIAGPSLTSGGRFGVAAIVPRTGDPEDDLVVYEEKTDRRTVDWILGLRKKNK